MGSHRLPASATKHLPQENEGHDNTEVRKREKESPGFFVLS